MLLTLNILCFFSYSKATKILILEVCFILYYLKLSGTNGLWNNHLRCAMMGELALTSLDFYY